MSGLSGPEPLKEADIEYQNLIRMVEALLFAAAEPLDDATLASRLPQDAPLEKLLASLRQSYAPRGVNLIQVAGRWAFRTAPDLAFLMEKERKVSRRLSKASLETLAIVAYHQPVTRAEIEDIRGVSVNRGTLDLLMEAGWVRMMGRRRSPGRPVTYGTTDGFLEHFGLPAIGDLPGMDELKATGLVEGETTLPLFPQEPDDDDGETGAADEMAE
jgi:segregation and condensation protein B